MLLLVFAVGTASEASEGADRSAAAGVTAGEPDYSAWTALLRKHYDERKGMNYRALKATDMATLQQLRQNLARVNVGSLDRNQQLAYWINLYNINVVAIVAEKYPVKSIRDISTDPIARLNVFKKDSVPFGSGKISLNDIENDRIRKGFKDARIHFAINCAARSCPPIRGEGAYTGKDLNAQLDQQTRDFLNGPLGAVVTTKADKSAVVAVTKIMDWFGDDFDSWGGGRATFVRRYVPADKQRMIDLAEKLAFEYDDYDWALNDWKP